MFVKPITRVHCAIITCIGWLSLNSKYLFIYQFFPRIFDFIPFFIFYLFVYQDVTNGAGIVLPNGRGQPRKQTRRVTEHDIESMEKAEASARAKLKSVLDKASDQAKEISQKMG